MKFKASCHYDEIQFCKNYCNKFASFSEWQFESDNTRHAPQNKQNNKRDLACSLDISVLQIFLKEGILKKLSRKVMQPRMFFLVQ